MDLGRDMYAELLKALTPESQTLSNGDERASFLLVELGDDGVSRVRHYSAEHTS